MIDRSGFFISPDGVIIPADMTQIQTVIGHPEKFGLDREALKELCRADDVPPGLVRDLQAEVLVGLVSRGWTRILRTSEYWFLQVPRISGRMRGVLKAFAKMVIHGEPPFIRKTESYHPVRVTSLLTGRTVELTIAELAGTVAASWHGIYEDYMREVHSLNVLDITDYMPKKAAVRPGPEEQMMRLLERTGRSKRSKVLLYLSSGIKENAAYRKLQYKLVILSDVLFPRFEVKDGSIAFMACRNAETIEWLRETGVRVHCVLTLNCGCNEGGNFGCENSRERFERLAPVLADGCLYVYDHTTIDGQYREFKEINNLPTDWFTGFAAESADEQAIETVASMVNDTCKVVKLTRLKEGAGQIDRETSP